MSKLTKMNKLGLKLATVSAIAMLGVSVGSTTAHAGDICAPFDATTGAFTGNLNPGANPNGVGSFECSPGDTAEAPANFASAYGWRARALGLSTVAVGNNAEAAGTSAIAVGSFSNAAGIDSSAVGTCLLYTSPSPRDS